MPLYDSLYLIDLRTPLNFVDFNLRINKLNWKRIISQNQYQTLKNIAFNLFPLNQPNLTKSKKYFIFS